MKVVCALISGVCALALLGGCGGGSDETTAKAKETLTKAEFRAQADAICATAERRRGAAIAAAAKGRGRLNLTDSKSTEDLILEAVVPVLRRMSAELAELGSPDAKAAAIVKAFEASVEGTAERPRRFLQEGLAQFGKARSLAASYGLKTCGII